MAFGDLEGLTLKAVDSDLFRNIVSLRKSQDLFDDLSDDPEDWSAAIELEITCKPPQFQSGQPIIDRPFEEAAFFEAIRFPFDNPGASRFSSGYFGVWYASETLETTIHETVHHWRNGLLLDAGWQDVEGVAIERRVHLVRCNGALVNLLSMAKEWPELLSDDYSACQALGESFDRQGLPGLLTISARCSGVNAAVFNSNLLSNPRAHCYLTYRVEKGRVNVCRSEDEKLISVL